MRALVLALALAGCYVDGPYVETEPVVMVDDVDVCLTAAIPAGYCEYDYYWVTPNYTYRGVWHGGHYVHRPGHPYVRHRRR